MSTRAQQNTKYWLTDKAYDVLDRDTTPAPDPVLPVTLPLTLDELHAHLDRLALYERSRGRDCCGQTAEQIGLLVDDAIKAAES